MVLVLHLGVLWGLVGWGRDLVAFWKLVAIGDVVVPSVVGMGILIKWRCGEREGYVLGRMDVLIDTTL